MKEREDERERGRKKDEEEIGRKRVEGKREEEGGRVEKGDTPRPNLPILNISLTVGK